MVDDAPWKAVGIVEPPYWERQTELLYEATDGREDEEPEWTTSGGCWCIR